MGSWLIQAVREGLGWAVVILIDAWFAFICVCVDFLWPHFAASQACAPFAELPELKVHKHLVPGLMNMRFWMHETWWVKKTLKVLLKGKPF